MFNKIKHIFGVAKYKVIEHSPEILIGLGIVGTIGTTILACKATLKSQEAIKKGKEYKEITKKNKEKFSEKDYSQEDYKNDNLVISANVAKEVALNYLPAVTLGALSITSILCGYRVMTKRTLALVTAYNALEKSFTTYRERVIEDQGAEKDKEYMSGVKAIEMNKKVTDKNGKTTTKKIKQKVMYGRPISPYARWYTAPISKEAFENLLNSPHNPFPKDTTYEDYLLYAGTDLFSSREMNIMTLTAIEMNLNDLLYARENHTVFLNDFYDMAGFKRTEAGQQVGWSLNNPNSDKRISLGLDKYPLELNYQRGSILIDPNVDGLILNNGKGLKEKI